MPNKPIKIKVQSYLSCVSLFLIIFFLIALLFVIIFTVNKIYFFDTNPPYFISLLPLTFLVYFSQLSSNKEYISAIEITNYDLTLIYKTAQKISGKQIIPLNDIKYFWAKFNFDISFRRRLYADAYIEIQTSEDTIIFSKEARFYDNLKFMKELLQNSRYIPFFSYELSGNALNEKPYIKKDLEYSYTYGKDMSLSESILNLWLNSSLYDKMTFWVILLLIVVVFTVLIYFCYFV